MPWHERRTLRIPGYNYTQPGSYFVTICTNDRFPLFGEIVDCEMRLSAFGKIAHEEWFKSARIRPYLRLGADEYVVMPNHVHGIVHIVQGDDVGARRAVPLRGLGSSTAERFGKPVSGSIPTIVRAFKAAVTRRINEFRRTPGAAVWQGGFHDHVIRDADSLQRIRQYISENPSQWTTDPENV